MNPASWQGRRLVPRWRSLSATLKSQELAKPGDHRESAPEGHRLELLANLERWHLKPSLQSAAEVVEAALVSGDETQAIEAARRLVTIDTNATPLIREQAARLLIRTGHRDDIPANLNPRDTLPKSRRGRVRAHPQDALAWVELALEQTIRGHAKPALRSMAVARGLAPHNRHVIRSSARLFLHAGDPGKAHALVLRNLATPTDPWLIASEIALAEVAEQRSRFFKTGQKMLDAGGTSARQITELAGAVATEQLLSGNRRGARKTFRKSMLDPTGSALAQAEWATPDVGDDLVPASRFCSAPEPAEAVAMHYYRCRDYSHVAPACRGWAVSDPFSIRPFEFACATLGLIADYDTSLAFAEQGLKIRPFAPTLLNAAAFALASRGEPDRAREFIRLVSSGGNEYIESLTSANKGLIAFRMEDFDTGLALYNTSIEGFRRIGEHFMSARAKIFLAREAIIANLPTVSEIVEDAVKSNEKYKQDHADVLLQQLKDIAELIRQEGRSAVDLSVLLK